MQRSEKHTNLQRRIWNARVKGGQGQIHPQASGVGQKTHKRQQTEGERKEEEIHDGRRTNERGSGADKKKSPTRKGMRREGDKQKQQTYDAWRKNAIDEGRAQTDKCVR
jgi:hypothetical protein